MAWFAGWLGITDHPPEERDRIRNVGIGCLVAALGYLGSVVEGVRLWHAGIGIPSLLATVVIIAALFLLRRTQRYALTGHVVLTAVYVFQAIILSLAGGFANPAVIVLFAIPIGAAVLISVRASVFWGVMSFMLLVALWIAQSIDLPLGALPFDPGDANVLVNRSIVLGAIVVMIAIFVNSQDAAEKRMRESHAEFQREATYVKLLMDSAMAANESATLRDALGRCLHDVCEYKEWPLAHAYPIDGTEANNPKPIQYVALSVGLAHHRFVHEASNLLIDTAPDGSSSKLPPIEGGLWDSRVADSQNPYRRALAEQLGLTDRVLVLVEIGDQDWVFEFFATSALEPDEEFIAVLQNMGTQLSRVVERSRSRSRIRDLAYSDPLTGLPNRRHLGEVLNTHLAAVDDGMHVALLHIGLDRFKTINEALGHTIGDRLLCKVAKRLQDAVVVSGLDGGHEERVFRLGGDEFAVVLDDIATPAAAAVLAQRILHGLAEPLQVGGNEVFTTASLGIAISEIDANQTPALLRSADSALAAAKKEGGGRMRYYAADLNEASKRRLFLEHQLRRAIDRDELELAYQPLIDATTDEMVGAEALLRWTTSDGERISPAEFIPVAETTGQINDIGRWVLSRAAKQLADWRARGVGPRRVAVNTSVEQLRDPEFVEAVAEIVRENRVPAGCIEIEITESRLIGGDDIVFTSLDRLRDAGVSLALDDFGTGYSSLSLLKRLPIEKLKIDRSFVDGIENDESNSALVEAVVQIGRGLGLTIVAEGVENTTQADILRDKGADELQGYLFSRPVPAAELESGFKSPPRKPVVRGRAATLRLGKIAVNPVVGPN